MLMSMTGYGRAEAVGQDYAVEAEIRSVNGRFFKSHYKLPTQLSRFEAEIEKLLKKSFTRGTVDLYVKFTRTSNPGGYTFNTSAAKGYCRQLEKLKKEFNLEDEITLELLSTLPGVLESEESTDESEKLWPLLRRAIDDAAENVRVMREKEGAELRKDFATHLDTIDGLLAAVRERLPQSLEEYKVRLKERVRQLLEGTDVKLNDQDLTREIVLYIERSDIAEELSRMASHLNQFRDIMSSGGAVGRQLEFLGQEMHREANTMGAKVNDSKLSTIVTSMKTTVDKVREQVLNIE